MENACYVFTSFLYNNNFVRENFTALTNLDRIIEGKGTLIEKAIGAESLEYEITEDRIRFPWFTMTGEPYTLLGYRVFVSKSLPDVEGGAIPVLFGDFNWFWIAERGKRIIKRLEERFADSGQVAFITSERVDGVLVLPDAVKSLKIAE